MANNESKVKSKRKDDELKRLKKELRELKKEVKELEKIVHEFMSSPQKALLMMFGYPIDTQIFDGDGLGIDYVKAIKKAHKEKLLVQELIDEPEVLEEVEKYLEDDENRQDHSSKEKA